MNQHAWKPLYRYLLIISCSIFFGAIIGYAVRGWVLSEANIPFVPLARADAQASLTIPDLQHRGYYGGRLETVRDFGRQYGFSAKAVTYESDGVKQFAYMGMPDEKPPTGGYPAIIFCHGATPPGEYTTDSPIDSEIIAAYVAKGFVVIRPNYRGHGESGGKPESAYYSSGYAVDTLNLFAAMLVDPAINRNRIGIAGHSLGANVALKATLADYRIKSAVLFAGTNTDVQDIAASPPPSETSGFFSSKHRDQLIKDHGPVLNTNEFWRSMAAVNYLDELKVPTAIYHSDDDEIVPAIYSKHFYMRLRSLGKDAAYHPYATGNHGLAGTDAIENSEAFFEQTLF